jgi:acetyltransferase-like isoleucine patch superfamily enzyme
MDKKEVMMPYTFYTTDRLADHIKAGIATIGRYSYGAIKIVGGKSKLYIGNFCSIAAGCTIFLGAEHLPTRVTTYPFCAISRMKRVPQNWGGGEISGHPASKGDVIIGSDVWIGRNATILSGITIGDGAVIGANSVVTKNVLPYAIVAGNPARFIRYRFSQEEIDQLIQIAWWNWDDKTIIKAIPLLLSEDISLFIQRYGSTHSYVQTRHSNKEF